MKENNVQTELKITGMTCEHCVKAVTTELSALEGVSQVQISLVPEGISTAVVTSAADLSPVAVAAAIDEAGYELVTA